MRDTIILLLECVVHDIPPSLGAHARSCGLRRLTHLRYIESIEVLESIFTVCFTDIVVARDFLAKYASARNIRNIDISLRVKPLITELYFPAGPDGEPQPHIAGVPVTARRNPWEDLCRRLAALPRLRRLHVRLDSEDLRPWHKRVNEKAFFARLSRVKAREFVLHLPELPEVPELRGLPGAYLEGDLVKTTPFEVRRGPRPNNWQLHLSRVSGRNLVFLLLATLVVCAVAVAVLWY